MKEDDLVECGGCGDIFPNSEDGIRELEMHVVECSGSAHEAFATGDLVRLSLLGIDRLGWRDTDIETEVWEVVSVNDHLVRVRPFFRDVDSARSFHWNFLTRIGSVDPTA